MAQLTAQGIIKCQPPAAKQAKMAASQSAASVPIATKTTAAAVQDQPQQQGMPTDVDVSNKFCFVLWLGGGGLVKSRNNVKSDF